MVVEIGPLVAFQYFCSESGTKFRKVGTSSDFSPSSALSNTEVLGKLRDIGRTGIRQPSLLSTFRQSVPLLDPLSEKATGTDLTDAGDSSTADQGIAPTWAPEPSSCRASSCRLHGTRQQGTERRWA